MLITFSFVARLVKNEGKRFSVLCVFYFSSSVKCIHTKITITKRAVEQTQIIEEFAIRETRNPNKKRPDVNYYEREKKKNMKRFMLL